MPLLCMSTGVPPNSLGMWSCGLFKIMLHFHSVLPLTNILSGIQERKSNTIQGTGSLVRWKETGTGEGVGLEVYEGHLCHFSRKKREGESVDEYSYHHFPHNAFPEPLSIHANIPITPLGRSPSSHSLPKE